MTAQEATYDTPTVRRFPRTLYGCDAAFPTSPEYASSLQIFERRLDWIDAHWPLMFTLSAVVAVAAAAVTAWWPW